MTRQTFPQNPACEEKATDTAEPAFSSTLLWLFSFAIQNKWSLFQVSHAMTLSVQDYQ